jgi:hypothetical protein
MRGLRRMVRPRFSRGQEEEGDTPEKLTRPHFARGQETTQRADRPHVGSFATGQEHQIHHPERDYEGRFSRGQEGSDDLARRV